ncbi:sensor domain-containing protein [Mycobacterium sp. Y57]|uniref:sensor domain-containing protein n=1 Tax=Mycolicibacterium xanthum TaxID=2796469 RepID=UPI001C853582|nr:sensor domain-containing protein [Mycolicibacterium xanthum]MBX7434620.1 sensor domain-containing protein [Mycolicibacterium xanthum]
MSCSARRRTAAPLAVVAAAGLLAAGCTRQIDDATPTAQSLAAPIVTTQVVDLLSPDVLGEEGNLFASAQPDRCAGLAREVDPPFIQDNWPLATDGGHWTAIGDTTVYVEEMVAVYPYDFDPTAALESMRGTIGECRGTTLTVTTMAGRTYSFDVGAPAAEGPEGSVVWTLRAVDWNCDNTFVAAYNAAIEITACGAAGGFDIAALARQALDRIDALANTTA